MSPDVARQHLRTISKFQITKSQYVLAFIALFAILALGASSIFESNSTVKQAKVLTNAESPAASIIFTQRETLVYATRLAQWANGGTTRRSVQIARNLLAQRLAVVDSSGKSMGSRAEKGYWDALKSSDAIVDSAPVGVLPESTHSYYSAATAPIIDQILAEARRLVVSYQRSIDQEFVDSAKRTADRDRLNLIYFYIFISASGLFLFLNVRTNFKNYRLAGLALDADQVRLDETLKELRTTQSTVVELRDLDQAKNAFISTVNHELRTPLTSIIGYIEIMRDQEDVNSNPETSKYLDVLDRNAQILLHLVESMLSLSKIDSDEGRLPETKVSLNEVIDNAIFIMKPASEKRAINVIFDKSSELSVQGDAGQLSQVLINLIGNAIKFSPVESLVTVRLSSITNQVGTECARIEVIDSGIGIPAEDIDHLFTRFFRAKNADSGQYPGTGLGLSIVQKVIVRHGGSVNVTSELGKGTTFTIEIPLFLTSEDRLILERRGDVLARGIAAIEAATARTLKSVAHEIGGAIGFYGYLNEGRELLEYSRRESDSELTTEDFESDQKDLLALLKTGANKMSGGENG